MPNKIPLSKCKLWWPAWQQGIPFIAYGYSREVTGEGYRFTVDPEMDSWLCENGELMPISTSQLCDSVRGPLKYSSFSIINGREVQVNYRIPGTDGYSVSHYPIERLSFVGETYSLDE